MIFDFVFGVLLYIGNKVVTLFLLLDLAISNPFYFTKNDVKGESEEILERLKSLQNKRSSSAQTPECEEAFSVVNKVAAFVLISKKKVFAKDRSGNKRQLEAFDKVYEGETLITGKNAFTQVVFLDGSVVKLASNSKIKINHYEYDAKKGTGNSEITAEKAMASFIVGKIANLTPNNYKVLSATAVIGIRGSAFSMIADKEKTIIEGHGAVAQAMIGSEELTDEAVVLDDYLVTLTIDNEGNISTQEPVMGIDKKINYQQRVLEIIDEQRGKKVKEKQFAFLPNLKVKQNKGYYDENG
jgi:hypothetical protein